MKNSIKSIVRVYLTFSLIIGFVLEVTLVSAQLVVVIDSDTTWTKADSPHTLTGPVLIEHGVTLTIEAGASVDLNGYEMRVNGTLRAIGLITDQIRFNNGEITFTEYSNGWDEQTGTGSSIQFAIFESVEVVTNVPVSINDNPLAEDTTWTTEDIPIDFPEQVTVDTGKVLTIEAGVTVNLYEHELIVKGTLRVLGSSSEKIQFNGVTDQGRIRFTESSNGWNEETGSGSIIENAVLNGVGITSAVSVKIVNSNIEGTVSVCGSSVIVDNTIQKLSISGGPVTVTNNNICDIGNCYGSPEITDNTIGMIVGTGGYPVISHNTIGGIGRLEPDKDRTQINFFYAKNLEITNNVVTKGIYVDCESGTISGNTITGYNHSYTYREYDYDAHSGLYYMYFPPPEITEYMLSDGIVLIGTANIIGNKISGCNRGISGGTIVQGNLLVNNDKGILVTHGSPIIQGNNITDSDIGISLESYAEIQNNTISNVSTAIRSNSDAKIHYNNIECYRNNSIYLDVNSGDVDATHNWWGTTDTEVIGLTIRDFKYDLDLGTVTFEPFLTEPNPEAMPSGTPEIPEFSSSVVLPLFVVVCLVAVFCGKLFGRRLGRL